MLGVEGTREEVRVLTERGLDVAPFQALLGTVGARPARAADAVAGVLPSLVVEPSNVEEAATVMRLCAEQRLRVAPRGGGTHLGLGHSPAGLDVLLSTRRLDRVVEHAWGDMTATVQAGVTLADLQATLAQHGQFLALDAPFPERTTVGGLIAADESGALRLRYGGVRDLLIGVAVVRWDGALAHGGGKVVKNVAGYDLPKLFTGALGTLGLIVEATFRLHPLPRASETFVLSADTVEQAGAFVLDLLASTLVPTGASVRWRGGDDCTLLLRLTGSQAAVREQADGLRALASGHRLGLSVLPEAERGPVWRTLLEDPWQPAASRAVLRLGILPSELPATLRYVQSVARIGGLTARATFHAHGLGLARLEGHGDTLSAMLPDLRARLADRGGSLVVLDAPAEVTQAVDPWGLAPDTLPLMEAVRRQFDPHNLLNPGRLLPLSASTNRGAAHPATSQPAVLSTQSSQGTPSPA